jgi:hypothetical protein
MNGIWAEACDVENAMAPDASATAAADPNKTLENLCMVISLQGPPGPRVLVEFCPMNQLLAIKPETAGTPT